MNKHRATIVTFTDDRGYRWNVWVWHDGTAEVNCDTGDGRGLLPFGRVVEVEQQT